LPTGTRSAHRDRGRGGTREWATELTGDEKKRMRGRREDRRQEGMYSTPWQQKNAIPRGGTTAMPAALAEADNASTAEQRQRDRRAVMSASCVHVSVLM